MHNLPESTLNLILSGIMGAIAGLISLPINTYITWMLKHDEQTYQHKLDVIAKRRELLLQHNLEMRTKACDNEIPRIWDAIKELEKKVYDG